jgi:hypothetical protein
MSPLDTQVAAASPRRAPHRLRIVSWLLGSGAVLGCVFAGLAWAEGEIARRVVASGARRGLVVEVGDVSVPLVGGIALSQVRLAAEGLPLAELDEIETDLGVFGVIAGARRPGRVRLVGGSVSVAVGADGVRGWSRVLASGSEADEEGSGTASAASPVAVDFEGLTVWLEGGWSAPSLTRLLGASGLTPSPEAGVTLPEPVTAVVTGTLERDASRRLSGSLLAALRQGDRVASLRLLMAPTSFDVEVDPGGAPLAIEAGGASAEVRFAAASFAREAHGEGVEVLRGRLAGAELRLGERRLGLSELVIVSDDAAAPAVTLAVQGLEARLGGLGPFIDAEARVGSARVQLKDPLRHIAAGQPASSVVGLAVEGPELVLQLPKGLIPDVVAGVRPPESVEEEAEEAPLPQERPGDVAARAVTGPVPPEAALDKAGTFTIFDTLFERAAGLEARVTDLLATRSELVRTMAALAPTIEGGRLSLREAGGAELLGLSAGGLQLSIAPSGLLRGALTAEFRRGDAEAARVGIDAVIAPDGRVDEVRLQLKGTEVAGRVASLIPHLRVEPETAVDLDLRWTPPRAPGSPHHVAGSFAFSDLTFNHWRISDRDIEDLRGALALEAIIDLEGRHLVLNLPEIRVGEATLEGHFEVQKRQGEKPAFRFRLAMPHQDCGAAARAIPRSLLPNLSTLALHGEANFEARLDVDMARPRELQLNVDGDLERCEVVSLGPGIDPATLLEDFVHHPREPKRGELTHIKVGRGTPSWVPSGSVPRHAKLAAEVTEDRSWGVHKGVDWVLVAAALKLDLEHGRFVYGGSTITQQLVKNIYLTRRKNLGRKFEEAIIAMQMERVLTKDQIMTLYVNCIEYGPDLYGIKAAASHYFGKMPFELDPLESAFIMGLKPYPKAGYRQWYLGTLDPWWVKRVSSVLRRIARFSGPALTPEMAELYAPFQPVFRRPGGGRPTPPPGYPTPSGQTVVPGSPADAPVPDGLAPAADGLARRPEEPAPAPAAVNEAGGPTPPPEAAP